MVALLAIVLAVGLLYFWLLGHWFARALVFIPFAIVGAIMFVGGVASLSNHESGVLIPLGALFGAMGWCIGSAPTWYYQWRLASAGMTHKALIPYPTHGP